MADLVGDVRAKVNLIPYNSGPGLPYRAPRFDRVLGFQKILMDRNIPTFIRISRGRDISAACGQLSLAEEAAHSPMGSSDHHVIG